MEYEKYSEIMSALGIAFGKEYSDTELKLFYRYFKDYKEKDFIDAVDSCITSLDKLPTVHQLEIQCERFRVKNELDEAYKNLPPITKEDELEFEEIKNSFK